MGFSTAVSAAVSAGARLLLAGAALWAASAYADAPPLTEFPNTGQFTARLLTTSKNVAVMELAGNYDKEVAGQMNVEPRAVVSKAFLDKFADKYDFIVVFSNFEFNTGDARAFYLTVKNDTQGLGDQIFDNTVHFGSKGKLQGYIDMAALSRYVLTPSDARFDEVMQVLSHEMLHRWAAKIKYIDASGKASSDLLGKDGAHWSFLLDSGGSVEYGNRWGDNGDGTYTSRAMREIYSPLDLYLMGMLKKEEVPNFHLIRSPGVDPTRLPEVGVTVSGTREEISINQVIAANGPRVPDASTSPKQFRLGFVLLTRGIGDVTLDQITQVNNVREAFEQRLATMTGGRSLVQAFIEPKATLVQAEDPTLGTVTLPGNGGATGDVNTAFEWLHDKQARDGSWADNALTRLRDTTVAASAVELAGQTGGLDQAKAWLSQQTIGNTDYVARRVQALGLAALPADFVLLAAQQNSDGGWGAALGYRSTPLDTALAVLAFTQDADTARKTAVSNKARAFLLSTQNSDGGWSHTVNGASRTSTTTQALRALAVLNAPEAATKAALFLAGRQNVDGGFGDSPSTVHDTANVLLALTDAGQVGVVRDADALSFLKQTQRADGSWDGSVYATSLAARAVMTARTYNWAVSGFTATPDAVRDGQRVALSISVTNAGVVSSPASILRLYDGAAGTGTVITDLAVPPLLAGASTTLKASWSTTGLAGNHVVTALVDPMVTGAETTRGDNAAQARVTVAAAPVQADLSITPADISVTPASINRLPTTINVTAQVGNLGGTDALGVKVRLLAGPSADSLSVVDERTVNLLARSTQPVNASFEVTKPGKQVLAVVVDADNSSSDVDRTNNRAEVTIDTVSSFDPAVLPRELVVPAQPVANGADITLQATIRNNGTADSPSFQAVFSVTDGSSERELQRTAVQLPAGGSKVFTLPWRVDLTGNLDFKVSLDPAGAVADLDRSNNTATAAFAATLPAAGVNLTVTGRDLSLLPTPLNEGRVAELKATVRNTGTVSASQVEVALYDADPASGGVMIGAPVLAGTLAAGGSASVTLPVPAVVGTDERLYFVVVDPANKIAETNELDNQAYVSATVRGMADLMVADSSFDVTPLMPRPGDTATVRVLVQNVGHQDALLVKVRLLDGSTLVGEQTLASVAAQSMSVASFTLTLPSQSASRSLTVVIDPDNTVQESNKANNTATRVLAVQDGVAFISEPFFSPNGDGIKDTVDFGFQSPGALVSRVVVVNEAGAIVRTMVLSTPSVQGGITWDGRSDEDRLVDDGRYTIRALAADGSVVGQGLTVLDTNRAPILAAMGTPAEYYRNLSCRLQGLSEWTLSGDEQSFFAFSYNGGQPNVFRLAAGDGEVTPLLSASFVSGSDTNSGLTMLTASARGDRVVFHRRQAGDGQSQVWLMNGDGSNPRMLLADDGSQDAGAVMDLSLSQDGTTLVSHVSTNDGRSLVRRHLLDGGTSAVLYDSKQHQGLTINQLVIAPNRRRALINATTGDQVHLWLLDLETGELVPAPADFYQAGRWYNIQLKWSPDSRYVVLYGTVDSLGTEAGNTVDYQLDVFDAQFKVVNRFRTNLGRDASSSAQDGQISNVDWTGDGMEIVFAHEPSQYGGGQENKDGTRFFYRANVQTGKMTQVKADDAAWSRAAPIWMAPTGRQVLSASNDSFRPDFYTVNIDNAGMGEAFPNWWGGDANPGWYRPSVAKFVPSGRRLLFTSERDAVNEQSACYQQDGAPQLFAYESLQNLIADIQVTRDTRLGGLVVSGTAADLYLSSYRLEYADLRTPTEWHAITLPGTEAKYGERLANWVPPAFGTYLVRMVAQDRAGNTATSQRRVSWSDTPTISGMTLDREYFSPNGDGVADTVKLSYDVREPVTLNFEVVNEAGEHVRSAERSHAITGPGFAFEWDGRDDAGRYVQDGKYVIRVLDFEYTVHVDTVFPRITVASSPHSFATGFPMPAPDLTFTAQAMSGPVDALEFDYASMNVGIEIVDAQLNYVWGTEFAGTENTVEHGRFVWDGTAPGKGTTAGTYYVLVSYLGTQTMMFAADVSRAVPAKVTFRPMSTVTGDPRFEFRVEDLQLAQNKVKIEAGWGDPPASWKTLYDNLAGPMVAPGVQVEDVKFPTDQELSTALGNGNFSSLSYANGRIRVSAEDRAGNLSSSTTDPVYQQDVVLKMADYELVYGESGVAGERVGLMKPSDFGQGALSLNKKAQSAGVVGNDLYIKDFTLAFADSLQEAAPRVEFRYTFVKSTAAATTPAPLPQDAANWPWTVVAVRGQQAGDAARPASFRVDDVAQQHTTKVSLDLPKQPAAGVWYMQLVHTDARGEKHPSNLYSFAVKPSGVPVKFGARGYHEPALTCDAAVSNIAHLDYTIYKAPIHNQEPQPVVTKFRLYRLLPDFRRVFLTETSGSNATDDFYFTYAISTADWGEGGVTFHLDVLREDDQTWETLPSGIVVSHKAPAVTLTAPQEGQKMCPSRVATDEGEYRYVPLDVSAVSRFAVIAAAQVDKGGDNWEYRGPAKLPENLTLGGVSVPIVSDPQGAFGNLCTQAPGLCGVAGPITYRDRGGVAPNEVKQLRAYGAKVGDDPSVLNGLQKIRAQFYGPGGHMSCRVVSVDVDGEVKGTVSLSSPLFSPNGDGRLDTVSSLIAAEEALRVKVEILRGIKDAEGRVTPADGEVLRTVVKDLAVAIGQAEVVWDGRADGGSVMADGVYIIRTVMVDDCGNTLTVDRSVELDNTPPAIAIDAPAANSLLSIETSVVGSVVDLHPDTYEVELRLDAEPDTAIPFPNRGGMNQPHTELARVKSMTKFGPGRLIVRGYDKAGNISEVAIPMTVDKIGDIIKSLLATPDVFSPNGDGRRDTVSLLYSLVRDARISVSIEDAKGQVVATPVVKAMVAAGDRYVVWDGKGLGGADVPDQQLTAVVLAEVLEDGVVQSQQDAKVTLTLDRKPPVITFIQPIGPLTSAAAGAQVRITDPQFSAATLEASVNGGAFVALGDADASGQLNASLDSLPEGPVKLRVTATDRAENSATSVLEVVIDRLPPKVTLTTPAANAFISGRKQPDAAIEGTIQEAHLANYRASVNGQAVFSATTAPVGSVLGTWTPLSVADGPATFTVRAEDQGGLTGEASVSITVDNTPPVAALKAGTGTTYLRVGSKILGTATDTNLQQYRLELSAGGAAAGLWNEIGRGSAAVADGVLLTVTALPKDGAYGLRLTVTDKAGNESTAVQDVTIDTTPPTPVTLTASSANNRDGDIRWTAASQSDVAGYALYRNGSRLNTAALLTDVRYTDSALAAGTYVYTVRVVDQAGNESDPSNEGRLLISSSDPVAQIFAPVKDGYAAGLADVRGTANASSDFKEYRLYVGVGAAPTSWQLLRQSPVAITADQLATWNTVGAVEGGVYTLRLEVENLVGQIASDRVTVKVKNSPPRAPLQLQGTLSNGNNIALSWTASPDEVQGYLLYRDQRLANATGVVIGSLTPYLIKPTAFNDGSVPDGLHRYQVVAMDAAGNVSDPSNEVEFRVDTRAPHVAITKPAEGGKVSQTVALIAESADADLATVQFQYRPETGGDWVSIGAPLTQASGPWTTNWKTDGLPLGNYQVRVVGTDEGGKVDPAPGFITLVVTDLRKPEAPTEVKARANGGDVTVTWKASSSSFATGYYIERLFVWGGAERLNSEPIIGTSYVDAGLNDETYPYRVVAVTVTKVESDPSATSTAVVFTPNFVQPYSPTAEAASGLVGDTRAQVQLTLRTETGNPVAQTTSNETGAFSFAAFPLAMGDNRYQLSAQDADGNISRTLGLRVLHGTAPATPVGLSAEVNDHRVDLSWTANTEADLFGYAAVVDGVSQGQSVNPVSALASSTVSYRYDASYAIDGNASTGWRPGISTSAVGQWLQVNLADRRLVDTITVRWARPEDVVARYVVEGFDGEVWVPLAERRIADGDTSVVDPVAEFRLDKPYLTDRLRVKLLALRTAQEQYTTQINEVTVSAAPIVSATTTRFDPVPDGRPRVGVRAVSTLGLASGLADTAITVGDVTPPEAPVLAATVNGMDVALTWTAQAVDDLAGFRIERDGVVITTLQDASARAYNDPSLANATYRYTVRALDAAGNASGPSNEAVVTVAIAGPNAPVTLSARAPEEGGRALLDWVVGAGAQPARFDLLRGTTAGGPYTAVASGLEGAQRSYVDDAVTNGTRYYYVVVPQDATGHAGASSNEVALLVDDRIPPGAPYFVLPGMSPGPVSTYDATTTLVGYADPGSFVVILRGNETLARVRASQSDEGQYFYTSNDRVFDTTPDGAVVYFRGDNGALFQADGTVIAAPNLRKQSNLTALRLTPDAQSAAFLRRDGGQLSLQRWNRADDSITRISTDVLDGPLAFSPDGRSLAVREWNDAMGGEVLLLVDWINGTRRELELQAAAMEWSPDGRTLAVLTYNEGLVLWTAADGAKRVLTTAVNPASLSWMPDGQSLLAEASDGNGRTAIVRVALADGQVTAIPDEGSGATYSNPAAAPDGSGFLAVRDGYSMVRRGFDGSEVMVGYAVSGYGAPRWTTSGNQVYLSSWNELTVLKPAGQFSLKDTPLALGAQQFSAYAQDESGNGSGQAMALEVRRLSDKLPDWQVTTDSWQVYPATPQVGESVTVALTVTNIGADAPATTARAVVVDETGNLVTLYDGQVPALARGEQFVLRATWTPKLAGRQVLVGSVDAANAVVEQNEDNNLASREVLVVTQGNKPEVSVVTDKARYAGGDAVTATVTAVYAGAALDGQVRLRIVDTGGYEVTTLTPKAITGLAFGEPKRVSFSWPSGTTLADTYRILAELTDGNGTALGSASTDFILEAGAKLEAAVTTDHADYLLNDNVATQGRLSFVSGNVASLDTPARLTVVNAAGETVASREVSLTGMLPGTEVRLDLGWSATQAGDYTAVLSAGPVGAPTAQASTVFHVGLPTAPLLQGRMQVAGEVFNTRETIELQVSLTNRGAMVDPLPVRVQALQTGNGAVLATWTVELNGVGSTAVARPAALTGTWPMGSFELRLAAQVQGTWTVLDKAAVSAAEQQAPGIGFLSPVADAVVRSDVRASLQVAARQAPVAQVETQAGNGNWIAASPVDVGAGSYAADLPAVDGEYVIKARATDTQGQASTVAQLRVVIDNTAPVLAISGVTDGATYMGVVTPVVTITEPHLATSQVLLDGQPFQSGGSVSASGTHVLSVSATDAAGNSSQAQVSFTIGTASPPTVAFVAPAEGAVVRSSVGVSAQAQAAQGTLARVELQVGDGAWTAMSGSGGAYTGALPAQDGTAVLKLRATDSSGSVSAVAQRTVVIDNTAPVVTISGVTDGGTSIGSATPVVQVTELHPGSTTLTLDGKAFVSGTTVTAVGSHVLAVTATDAAGNTTQRSLSFTVTAATGPVVGFVSPAADAIVRSQVGVTAQATSSQDTVSRVELQVGEGAWTAMTAAGGVYTAALPTTDGLVALKLRAYDSRGLVSEVVQRSLTIDNTAPTITVSGVVDGTHYTTSATPVITITDTHPGSSQITLDGVVFSSGTKVTAVGSHVLSVSATDAAGNTAQRSVSFVIDADNLPAQPAVIGASNGEPGRLLAYVACTRTVDEVWTNVYQLIIRGYDDEKTLWACTLDRSNWLRDYLGKRGIDATVVADEASFLNELRTGRYGSYWVGGGALLMGSLATAELQAAVRRGESLVTEGWRPLRTDGMQYLAGLTSVSAMSSDTATAVISGSGLPTAKLQVSGPVRVTASGVTVAGTLSTGTLASPAVMIRPFGSGGVVSFAFDLNRSLRDKSATDNTWNDLVLASLKLVAPAAKPSVVAGGVVDLRSAVSNKASSALEMEVVTKTPADMTMLAQSPVPTSVKVEGGMPTIRWNATLAGGGAQAFTAQVRAPENRSGSFVVTTMVNVKKSGVNTLSDTQTITLKVRSTADMIETSYDEVSGVKGLSALLPKVSALGWIALAKTSAAFGLWQDTLRQLIAAQATMQNVTGDGAEEARYAIARAIEAVERRLCTP